MENALTPLVASLIFATSRALGLKVEEQRDALAEAIARDDLFPREVGEPMPETIADSGAAWAERYARLDPRVRNVVVTEALARLKAR
ncbi:MAG: hypothetical protein JO165_11385 [Candidatus Eremiobacteraeota bacterium]|nr:hypothetical protein [Candidatus Eremiobacteraeota bacterium]